MLQSTDNFVVVSKAEGGNYMVRGDRPAKEVPVADAMLLTIRLARRFPGERAVTDEEIRQRRKDALAAASPIVRKVVQVRGCHL